MPRLFTFSFFVFFLAVIPGIANSASYTANPDASSQAGDLLQIIQDSHYADTGISSNVGLTLGNDVFTISGAGVDADGQFRIGSQSKMFAGSAILIMIDRGYFSLTDTLGELQSKYNVDLGLSTLPEGTESITVEQLLNMSSEIPNYMAGTRSGSTSTLWDDWIAANYGALTPEVTHPELAALGLTNYPQTASAPWQGTYSNTNIVILALIGEAAYETETGVTKTFADILDELVLTPAGLTNTYLATTADSTGIITGSEAGQDITDMDVTIPWVSGAVVSTIEDQLTWLQILKTNTLPDGTQLLSDELFAARTDLANSTLISMAGMPLYYGYNVFTLDFTGWDIPLTIIGHGGSIAGYSSFSAWYEQLGLGLVVNAPSLSTIDKNGFYTGTPSETLLMNLIRGMERLYRSDGSLNGLASVAAGDNGGYFTFSPIVTDAASSSTFTVEPSGRTTSYLDLVFIDITGNPVITTIDPTLTFYTNSTDQAAVTLTSGVTGTVQADARAESYGPTVTTFDIQSGASLLLQGEAGAYGDAPTAITVESGGSLSTEDGSLAYIQGGGGSAIDVKSGAGTVTIAGTAAAVGSSAALSVDGSSVTVAESGLLTAVTGSVSMNSDFETVSPETHAVYGAVLTNGATLDLYGTTLATAVYAWDGTPITTGVYISDPTYMPGVLATGIDMTGSTAIIHGLVSSTGYGVWMHDGTGSTLTVDGGAISGTLYSVLAGSGNDVITISNGGILAGNIDLGTGTDSLTASEASLILDLSAGTAISGVETLTFSSDTTIDPGLSGVLGDATYTLASGVSSYTGTPTVLTTSNPVTLALTQSGSEVLLTTTRDWNYYATLAENDSLGSVLDRMAAAAVADTLSTSGSTLIENLDTSSTPESDVSELQPHPTDGLAMSQLRQLPAIHRALEHQFALNPQDADHQWFAFSGLHGHMGQKEGTGSAADGYDFNGGGMTVGGGRNIGPDLQIGLFLDYGMENQSYTDTGDMDDTILRMGPFARWTHGATTWSSTLSLGLHDVSSNRDVPFLDESNTADFSMRDLMLSTALTHDFDLGAVRLTPVLEGALMTIDSDSYSEDGGISALKVEDARATYLFTSAGLDVSYTFRAGQASITPRIGAAWSRQWFEAPDTDAAFRSDPSFTFSTDSDADDNLLRLKAGVDIEIPQGLRVNIDYSRYDGASTHDNNVLALTLGFVF